MQTLLRIEGLMMKTVVNKVEMRRDWYLSHWYEKACYLVGVVYVILFTLGFCIGFFGRLLAR